MKGNKIVHKAPKGITFNVQEEKDGVIVIKAIHESKKISSEYNYKNPIIPKGFTYLKGEWKKGFTIRNLADGSEFVWVPVGYLKKDGTIDGENFNQSFGRRNFRGEEFSSKEFHETADLEMIKSVKKYGGYYISAYLASAENGKLVFKKGNMPWANISQQEAKEAAKSYAGGNSNIVTCLPSGAAYDTIFKWIIQTGEKTFDDVVYDSTKWGNYCNTKESPIAVAPTGSNESYKVLGIYDLAGNCAEWSTEQYGISFVISRGRYCYFNGYDWPAARRDVNYPDVIYCNFSFRTVLYVK